MDSNEKQNVYRKINKIIGLGDQENGGATNKDRELQIMSSALFACCVLEQVQCDGKSSAKFKVKEKIRQKSPRKYS